MPLSLLDRLVNGLPSQALDVFPWLAEQQITWTEIVSSLVMTPPDSEGEKSVRADLMDKLLHYRDVFDISLYHEAVTLGLQDIFEGIVFDPAQIKANETGFIRPDSKGNPLVALRYYVIRVYDSTQAAVHHSDDTTPYWEIAIKAPGSRTPTSDIDTTVSVRRLPVHTPLPVYCDDASKDYANRLKNRVIAHFHLASRDRCFGIGPGLSRDSNVYSDGFMEEDAEGHYVHYDKFPLHELDVAGTFEALVGQPYPQLYAKAKTQKHLYEYAASFISLRAYFGRDVEKWQAFKAQVITCIEEVVMHEVVQDASRLSQNDFEAVCNITELFFSEQQRRLSSLPAMSDDKTTAENVLLNWMHDVYVRQLDRVVSFQETMMQLDMQLSPMRQKAEQARDDLLQKHNIVLTFQNMSESVRSTLKLPIEAALIAQTTAVDISEKVKKDLRQLLLKKAATQNDMQLALVGANLFAHEAYINRSAPQHVVVGLQSGQAQAPAKQLIICSALQQIGFRLYHAQLQRQCGMSGGEVAYRNAKYAKRLMGLLLGEVVIEDDRKINLFTAPGGWGGHSLFPALPRAQVTTAALSKQEYHLLVSEMRIAGLKDERGLSDDEKPQRAAILLQERQLKLKAPVNPASIAEQEEALYCSLAAKITAWGYRLKMDAKQGLWGVMQGSRLLVVPRMTSLPQGLFFDPSHERTRTPPSNSEESRHSSKFSPGDPCLSFPLRGIASPPPQSEGSRSRRVVEQRNSASPKQ